MDKIVENKELVEKLVQFYLDNNDKEKLDMLLSHKFVKVDKSAEWEKLWYSSTNNINVEQVLKFFNNNYIFDPTINNNLPLQWASSQSTTARPTCRPISSG